MKEEMEHEKPRKVEAIGQLFHAFEEWRGGWRNPDENRRFLYLSVCSGRYGRFAEGEQKHKGGKTAVLLCRELYAESCIFLSAVTQEGFGRERGRDNACDVGKRRLVRGVNYMMITHQQMGHD